MMINHQQENETSELFFKKKSMIDLRRENDEKQQQIKRFDSKVMIRRQTLLKVLIYF
jgi:hypothetical protein